MLSSQDITAITLLLSGTSFLLGLYHVADKPRSWWAWLLLVVPFLVIVMMELH
jgi:hypothetical protein